MKQLLVLYPMFARLNSQHIINFTKSFINVHHSTLKTSTCCHNVSVHPLTMILITGCTSSLFMSLWTNIKWIMLYSPLIVLCTCILVKDVCGLISRMWYKIHEKSKVRHTISKGNNRQFLYLPKPGVRDLQHFYQNPWHIIGDNIWP